MLLLTKVNPWVQANGGNLQIVWPDDLRPGFQFMPDLGVMPHRGVIKWQGNEPLKHTRQSREAPLAAFTLVGPVPEFRLDHGA